MPISRKRKSRKRRGSAPRLSPYEALLKGVHDDDRMRSLFARARWSFFRAPFPAADDPEAQDCAMARAMEWFLFDLPIPGTDRTPAETWVARSARQHRWTDEVVRRYAPLTRSEYGLFEVIANEDPVLVLKHVGSGRVVHALNPDSWLFPSRGDVLAARLFPVDHLPLEALTPVFHLSPGSDVVPASARKQAAKVAADDPLDVERLFGASPEWMAAAVIEPEFPILAEQCLELVVGEGTRAADLLTDLRELDDPSPVIGAVVSQVVPLTPEEPAVLSGMLGTLWLRAHLDAGATESQIRRLASVAKKQLIAKKGTAALWEPPVLTPVSDARFQLSEHELVRLRELPIAADAVWAGRRQMVRMVIGEKDQLPKYPDAILWMEEPSGAIVGAHVVPQDHEPEAVLKLLVDAMANPAPSAGRPRRPARIRVSNAWLAGRLAAALAPLGIEVEVRYGEPTLADAFRQFEEALERDAPGESSGRVGGYLDLPGSTPEQVARLFDAAARFYEAAPWKAIDDSCWIEIDITGFDGPPVRRSAENVVQATAVVMGAGGETFGMALYFHEHELVALHAGADPDVARHHDTLSVTFDAERDAPAGVLTETRRHGWRVAGRRAYPCALRTSPDAPMRLLVGDELDLASIALEAIRQFVARHETALVHRSDEIADEVRVDGVGVVRLSVPAAE